MQADDGGFRLIDFGKAVDLAGKGEDKDEDGHPTFRIVIQNLIRVFMIDNWYMIELGHAKNRMTFVDADEHGKPKDLPLIEANDNVTLHREEQAFVDRINKWVVDNASLLV